MMKLTFDQRFQTVTILIVNHRNLTRPTSQLQYKAATPKHQSDDLKTHIKSVEDKLLIKIVVLKSHLFNDIFDLRNDITSLKKTMKKKKPGGSNNEKEKVLLLKERIRFLESENNVLKSDIIIEQKKMDSILKYNSNLLNHQIVEYCKILTMKTIKREV